MDTSSSASQEIEMSVNRSQTSACLAAATLLICLPLGLPAQTYDKYNKPPPRLPNPSQTSQIPAGADGGSPWTSDSMSLGTSVPPNMNRDGTESLNSSAAARAAARGRPTAKSIDCLNVNSAAASAAARSTATKTVAGPKSVGASAPAAAKATSTRPPSGC
jgi:hypothetical protein